MKNENIKNWTLDGKTSVMLLCHFADIILTIQNLLLSNYNEEKNMEN